VQQHRRRDLGPVTVESTDRFGKPTQFTTRTTTKLDPPTVDKARGPATERSVMGPSTGRTGGSVNSHMDLIDGVKAIGKMSRQQSRKSWRQGRTDHERPTGVNESGPELQQTVHVVKIVTDGDHRDLTSGEGLSELGVATGVSQHSDVSRLAKRRRFTARVVKAHIVMHEQSLNAPPDDTVSDQPDGHGASPSAMLIGRQPPCWGGVPPRPFTRSAAAAAPVMNSAVMIRRSTFTPPLLPFASSCAPRDGAAAGIEVNGPCISAIRP
jgi:hypothetical protein